MPFNAEGGFYNQLANYLRRARLGSPDRVARYKDLLMEYSQYLVHQITLLEAGITHGVVPSKLVASKYYDLVPPFTSKY